MVIRPDQPRSVISEKGKNYSTIPSKCQNGTSKDGKEHEYLKWVLMWRSDKSIRLPFDAIIKCKETRMGYETEWQERAKHLGKREAANTQVDDVIFPYLEIRHVPDLVLPWFDSRRLTRGTESPGVD